MYKPVAFVILDGFGYRTESTYNAIHKAHMPHIQQWRATYPFQQLAASGSSVGLLSGMIGNSEAGHTTIGAGYIVPQPVRIIHEAIDDKSFFNNTILVQSLQDIAHHQSTLHIIVLLSDAGIHSHTKHLYAYLQLAQLYQLPRIVLHPILDGRDSPPKSAIEELQDLQDYIDHIPTITIGSIHGRFYAMDRDHNWERTQQSYRILTQPQTHTYSWRDIINRAYDSGFTDEFVAPAQCDAKGIITKGDSILSVHFRPERSIQLLQSLLDPAFCAFERTYIPIHRCITPVAYPGLHTRVLFPTTIIQNTLKELLSRTHRRIFTIAETEKYAHVTYFLGGGRAEPFPGETQVMIPSKKVITYAQAPPMSAPAITERIVQSTCEDLHDIYIINYANADMVGHSGDMDATVHALTCLDRQLAQLYQRFVVELNGTLIITADHGKAEEMFDDNAQQPRTAHTTNPVPFFCIDNKHQCVKPLPKQLAEIKQWLLLYLSR